MFALSGVIGRAFTGDADVLALCRKVLPIVGAFQIFDSTQGVCSGILRGMGRQRIGAVVNALGYYAVALPLVFTFTFAAGLGLPGIWMGLTGGVVVQAASFLFIIARTKWTDEARKAVQRSSDPESDPDAAAAALATGQESNDGIGGDDDDDGAIVMVTLDGDNDAAADNDPVDEDDDDGLVGGRIDVEASSAALLVSPVTGRKHRPTAKTPSFPRRVVMKRAGALAVALAVVSAAAAARVIWDRRHPYQAALTEGEGCGGGVDCANVNATAATSLPGAAHSGGPTAWSTATAASPRASPTPVLRARLRR